MSTFNGVVPEFPEIRVDYFRTVPDIIPPLAYFLSHVHSDHLQGLESIRAPFIYCSYATRELLLKLEKRPHRLNFTKGILEGRVQTYGHLGNLAKPLPLNTPTTIELSPTENVRVTLFDANHCPGAVMFLFEGNGKAVLYTGDLRAESWWCQQLARHPVLLPYTKGLRTIDCIYLDTTFATKKDIFRQFPSKRDGICDLLTQIKEYPGDTVFHFDTWTFGYEDVWIALTTALNCEIHVDRYRGELYNNLGKTYPSGEAAVLGGFQYGNRFQMGRLTQGTYPRIHSCERGTPCPIFEDNRKVVRILPIISRFEDGTEVEEQGAGGGFGDLKQAHELEITDNESVGQLMSICAASIHDAEKLAKVLGMLVAKIPEKGSYNLTLTSNLPITDDMSLRDFVPILAEVAETKARNSYQASLRSSKLPTSQASTSAKNAAKLPEVITLSLGPLHNSLGNSLKTGNHSQPEELSETAYRHRRTKLDLENPEQAFRRKVWLDNPQLHRQYDGLKAYQALGNNHPDVKRFRIPRRNPFRIARKNPFIASQETSGCASTELTQPGSTGLALQSPGYPNNMGPPEPYMHVARQKMLREPVFEEPCAIRVGNLSRYTTGQDIRAFFGKWNIETVELTIRPSTAGNATGFETVLNLPSLGDAQTAVQELSGKMLMGRQVRVAIAGGIFDWRLAPPKTGANTEPLHKARNPETSYTNTAAPNVVPSPPPPPPGFQIPVQTGPPPQLPPGFQIPGLKPLTVSWSHVPPSPSKSLADIREKLRSLQTPNKGRSSPSGENRLITRQHSYNAAKCRDGTNWQSGVGLSSTGGSIRDREEEL
ncbi:MAG: hypothetical protein Q9157_007239 [Trypethelium eluteriae]